jgi:RHS repeat-associated protein
MGDVFNNALAPFQNAPPAEQGALGVVNQAIGAVMGLQGMGMELMNTGFAMATAGIAAAMPAFPAAFLTVPHVGMPHAHAHPPSLIPPAPPVPLPSIGTLMLAGSVGVLVCGMPAGRCGDLGLAVTCGSFSPAFDVFLGSSNTFIAGNRAARMMDMTRHCNPASAALAVSRGAALFSAAVGAVGVAADAAGGGAVVGSIAQIAADLAAAAMSALLGKDPGIPPAMGALMMGAPTVLIGGFPCPNLPDPLSAMMKGLKCLTKKFLKSKGFGKLLNKVGLCNQKGEPVNSFTGEVYNDIADYRAGDSGFAWERHYRSGWSREDGPLGFGYRHFFQRTLTLLRKRAIYETYDNEVVAVAKLSEGQYETRDGFSLSSADGRRYQLTTDRDEALEFEVLPTTPPSGRLTRYRSAGLDAYLQYDSAGRLYSITEFTAAGTVDTYFAYDARNHIEAVGRGPRGRKPAQIARYRYYDDCLVECQDAAGGTVHFRYDAARRMVRATDRRGYSFHWYYDPQSGRCIKSCGDDGLWGIEAKYEGTTSTFTEADGGQWTLKHYPDGTISHILDPYGGVTEYQKDGDRIEKQVTPGGLEYLWHYDAKGKHTHREDPWGNRLPPEDDEPNPDDPSDDPGPTTHRGWLFGRPTSELVPRLGWLPAGIRQALAQFGVPTASAASGKALYDTMGRIREWQHPDGSVERYQRDAEGNIVAYQDTRGNWTQRWIESWNLVGAEQSPTGSVTRYGYTHRGERAFVVDPNGNRTDYKHDRLHRLSETLFNGALFKRYEYDSKDVVIGEYDGAGSALIKHKPNALGLHIESVLSSGETYTYEYDAHGNYTKASSSQHDVRQTHDGELRLSDRRDGKGVIHHFRDGGWIDETEYFEAYSVDYELGDDDLWRVLSPDSGEHRFYAADRGIVVRENANGTNEACLFDAEERLVASVCWHRDSPDIGPFRSIHYRYNAESELTSIVDTERGLLEFTYDADHRLTEQRLSASVRSYQYDLAGNLIATPAFPRIERGPNNELVHSNLEKFEYDGRKRLAKRIRWDGVTTTYGYDSADQLVHVSWSDRKEEWRAAYDGLGRRVWREYGGKRTDFYWDDDRLAAERDPTGKLRLYVYANEDALVPFMWLDYDGDEELAASGRPYYLFCAPTGMPLCVEDARGDVVWQIAALDPYGAIEVAPGAKVEHRLRFAGHFYDEHLELFYNRFRDYDPKLGRYLQIDPLGHAGSANLYAYPANPVVHVDLRGLEIHRKPSNKKPKAKPKKKKPNLDQGEVGSYRDQKKKAAAPRKLDRDHIPSKAAVRRKMEQQLGKKLTPQQKRNLENNLTSAAIKTKTHKKGRTHGSKNTDAQVQKDSGNLRKAAKDDLKAHRENLKKDGMTDQQIKKMEKDIHDRNKAIGVYDDPLPMSLLQGPG